MLRRGSQDRTAPALAAAALAAGTAAWLWWLREGIVLAHYDAKAHLVVARRVVDSLTPGWQQIGAVWLPLPHLVHLLPTQIDVFYRTGAFASIVSILCFGATVWAAARLVLAMTGSRPGAVTAAAVLILNPNLLYLQATPMTEPMLLATVFVALLWLYEWVEAGAPPAPPRRLGVALAAALWTRYEAWPIVAAATALTALVLWRRGEPLAAIATRLAALLTWPAIAVGLFLVNSRITVGSWFVTGGFYVPEPFYDGHVWRSLVAVWWGTHRLSGYVLETTALVTALAIAFTTWRRRETTVRLIPLALFAVAALPFYAFVEGHPFRIRYMVVPVAACALFGGVAVGLLRQRVWATALAAVLVGSVVIESPPWHRTAPMLEEAQWDVPYSEGRRDVTACLAPVYAGEKVMASMGSLAHYMQELSRAGFDIADFLHEGNGVLWALALETGPAPHVGWMLVEERAEGGDVLAMRIRDDATFARGMVKVCEGGGVSLYRRQ